jgi:hypothetical protein
MVLCTIHHLFVTTDKGQSGASELSLEKKANYGRDRFERSHCGGMEHTKARAMRATGDLGGSPIGKKSIRRPQNRNSITIQ